MGGADRLAESARGRRRVAAVVGALVVAAAVGIAIALFAGGGSEPAPDEEPRRSASDVTATTEPTSSGDVPSQDASAGAEPTSAASAAKRVAPWVAYVVDGAVWVAREDGSRARKVTEDAGRGFALSPDGRTLAVATETSSAGPIRLVDVASGATRTVGFGLASEIDWAPDSAWLAYTSGADDARRVRIVAHDGSWDRELGQGHRPRVSGDGAFVAFGQGGPGEESAPLLVVSVADETSRIVLGSERAFDWAWNADGELLFVRADEFGADTAVYVNDPATGATSVDFNAPAEERAVSLGELRPSPFDDGLLFASVGDDGHCRLIVRAPGAEQAQRLETRMDAYPYRWSSDGKRILYFQGNEFQGQPSSLMSALPDGTGRTIVVKDAGRLVD